jgi:hypothetical protein
MGQYMDWMQLSWNEWVINYDFAHQVQMAQGMQRSSRNWSESARLWFEHQQKKAKHSLKIWQHDHHAFGVALPVVLGLFLLVLRSDMLRGAVRRLRLYWQLRAPESAQANPLLASRLYAELQRVLERRGLARPASQTPLEFATAVAEPNLAPAIREFTQVYAQARFGDVPCDALRLQQLLGQIRSALRSN